MKKAKNNKNQNLKDVYVVDNDLFENYAKELEDSPKKLKETRLICYFKSQS